MKMSDTVHIPAPPQEVWRGLNDPDVLKSAIPACKSIEKLSDTEFKAVASVAVGPVKASFSGKVTLSDLDPPNGYRISGEGTGGAAGFAKGAAQVRLTPKDGGTDLAYEVDASVGGKLAQIGQRFIDQAAKKLADEFFARFGAVVSGEAGAGAGAAPSAAPPDYGSEIEAERDAEMSIFTPDPFSPDRQVQEDFPAVVNPSTPAPMAPNLNELRPLHPEHPPEPAMRAAPASPPPQPESHTPKHRRHGLLILAIAVVIVTILWILQFLYLG